MTERAPEPPRAYAQWAALLDRLEKKDDDAAALDAMKRGTLEWQSGVAERFVKKLTGAINSRVKNASERFQKETARSKGQERELVRALLALRGELSFLAEAADIPAMPEKQREQCRSLVKEQAKAMQKSLEDSAKNDRSGKLSDIIKNNRVDAF